MASKSFHYADEITPEIARELGPVNEISMEMLKAISGLTFGEALAKLMSSDICGYSVGLLKNITGLDNRIQSDMRKNKNKMKHNVVTACLGIHLPFPVSERMLELSRNPLDFSLPGQDGLDDRHYDVILHLMWAEEYGDIYKDLKRQGLERLIHKPPKITI